MDAVFFRKVMLTPVCMIIFYLLLYKLFRYLFSRIKIDDPARPEGDRIYGGYPVWVALVIYSFCAAFFFFPALKTISTSLIGPAEDNMQHLWFWWWIQRAVFDPALSTTFSGHVFYPEGASLLYCDICWYNHLLYLPFKSFPIPVLLYNLLILKTFVLAGLGAFFLIRYLTRKPWVSIVGGFIFAFNPGHFARSLHHETYASIQFIPFFVLYFIKAIKGDSKKHLLLASLFFLLNALCNWNYMIFAFYFMGFSYIFLVFRRKQLWLPRVLVKIAVITLSSVLILSPRLAEMIIVGLNSPGLVATGHDFFVADSLSFLVPHPYHLLADIKIIGEINKSFTGFPWEKTAYLGIFNLLLVLFVFKRIINNTARYFCGFFIFLILSMGVSVHLSGISLPIILPYEIMRYIPFISNVRAPSRFMIYVYLFWAIIISFALKSLFDLYRSSRKKNIIIAVLIIMIFFDYYSICGSTTEAYLPSCYNVIRSEDDEFGILDLPGGWAENERYMMYQTYHGFPIVQGTVSRKIGRSLIDDLELDDLDKQEEQLRENKVKYIVIHNKLISPRRPVPVAKYLKKYEKIYGDEDNYLFRVY